MIRRIILLLVILSHTTAERNESGKTHGTGSVVNCYKVKWLWQEVLLTLNEIYVREVEVFSDHNIFSHLE